MKMAIVHDLAECIVGDITPFCGVSVEEKHAREEAAITGLCKDLPEDIGSELVNLWKVSWLVDILPCELPKLKIPRYDYSVCLTLSVVAYGPITNAFISLSF